MATCRFPGCARADQTSTLPAGWSLVHLETRDPDPTSLVINRVRWILCPRHAPFIARLCGRPDGSADAIVDAVLDVTVDVTVDITND
jgi:hypothetical protein